MKGQPKDASKPLQNAFKNPSKTFQEGVEIDDALGFPGLKNQFQGNESLDAREPRPGKSPKVLSRLLSEIGVLSRVPESALEVSLPVILTERAPPTMAYLDCDSSMFKMSAGRVGASSWLL